MEAAYPKTPERTRANTERAGIADFFFSQWFLWVQQRDQDKPFEHRVHYLDWFGVIHKINWHERTTTIYDTNL